MPEALKRGLQNRGPARPDAKTKEELQASEKRKTPVRVPALVRAARAGDKAAVDRLLAKGVSPDTADALGITALIAAAERGHTEVVEVLLAAGANPNRSDKNGATPLLRAAGGGHVDTVHALIAGGADVNASSPRAGRR